MKGNVMIFALLCLLLCWMLPVDSMTIRFNFTLRDAKKPIPLSIVEESVDDMYFGCTDKMMTKVKDKYFEEEHAKQYKHAWDEAIKCAKEKLKHRKDRALTKEHMQAICLYTSDDIYEVFNNAVRTSRSIYGSSFQFYALHFWLTSAVQTLNRNYFCHRTYRRTNVRFTGQVNQIIRFGSFASSSYRTDLKNFGSETCFKINTCSGAFLKDYSVFNDYEKEVLIPPYETFKITNKTEKINDIQGLEDCKVVYVLESAGVMSHLNCKGL